MRALIRSLFVGCILGLVQADNSVHILSSSYKDQIETSSILKWVSHIQYDANKAFVIGGFETIDSGGEKKEMKRSIFVCRALHNGLWVSGGQKEGDKRCAVGMFGTAAHYENYELLLNVDQAARLVWAEWDKYTPPEVGSVVSHLSAKMFVARYNSSGNFNSNFSHFVGSLNREDSFGKLSYVNDLGKVGSTDSGQVLKEIQPIRYDLKHVTMMRNKKRVQKVVRRQLGHSTIKNTGTKRAEFDEAFSYVDHTYMYWGQSPGLVKALNTTIQLQNGTMMPNISWGMPYEHNSTKVHTIKVVLEPNTGVNVTVSANFTEFDINYKGKIISSYADSGRVEPRQIFSSLQQKGLSEVIVEFSPVYFLSNFSLVPTTTTSTSPSPVTTSMTSTTTTTIASPSEATRDESSYDADLDENNVSGKTISRKSDNAMQADDGSPQKDKYESGSSSSNSNAVKFYHVAVSLTLIHFGKLMIT